MEIQPDTPRSELQQRLSRTSHEIARSSPRRQRYLERVGMMLLGRTDMSVRLHDGNAKCESTDRGFTIYVHNHELTQPVTDLPQQEWDLLAQETRLIHELGHVLWTDFNSFEEHYFEVPKQYRDAFSKAWNFLEDGFIERALAEKFNVEDDLLVKNANLFEANEPSSRLDMGGFRFVDAVILGLSDMAKYDAGRFGELLDPDGRYRFHNGQRELFVQEALPRMKSVVKDALTQKDAKKRNDRIRAFWDNIQALIEESSSSSDTDMQLGRGEPDDAENRPDGGEAAEGSEVTITIELSGEEEEDINGAGGAAPEGDEEFEEGDDTSEAESGTESDSDDEEGDGPGGEQGDDERGSEPGESDEEEEEADGEPDDRSDGLKEAQFSVRGKYSQGLSEEEGDTDKQLRAAVDFQEALEEADANRVEFVDEEKIADDFRAEYDSDTWHRMKRLGRKLKRTFQERLRQQQKDSERRGLRHGRFDTRRMTEAARGSTKVFRKKEPGEKKDYTFVLTLDRSGSQSDNTEVDGEDTTWVVEQEVVIGALAWALEEVGANVCILSLYSDTVQVEKPFNIDLEHRKHLVFTGRAYGGTPMDRAVDVSREHLLNEGGNKAMFVVTDARITGSTRDRYVDHVERCPFPVVGMYAGDDADSKGDGDKRLFHALRRCTEAEELFKETKALANQVMF